MSQYLLFVHYVEGQEPPDPRSSSRCRADAYDRAIGLVNNDAEKAFLERRRSQLG